VRFETTDWSLIQHARADDSSEARQAMARLFETYWPPVYAFIRRAGHSAADAEDLAQAYFARFYEKRYAGDFRPEAGRFRTFLRASLQHFLANEWDKTRAQKRGGTTRLLSLDSSAAEERYRLEPSHDLTPEALFEREWARALLATCLARLRREEEKDGRPERFQVLKPFLVGEGPGYEGPARALGLEEGAVRVAVHRLRKRFAGALREEIARTVEDPADVDSEIRWLMAALSGGA
jgi:RNA polymerase sigma-70 factor (ECF subfamily)